MTHPQRAENSNYTQGERLAYIHARLSLLEYIAGLIRTECAGLAPAWTACGSALDRNITFGGGDQTWGVGHAFDPDFRLQAFEREKDNFRVIVVTRVEAQAAIDGEPQTKERPNNRLRSRQCKMHNTKT